MTAPRLPHHRKYNWRIAYRNNKRAIWLGIAAALLGVLVLMGEQFLLEHNLRLQAQNDAATAIGTHMRLSNFGAPGWTPDDIRDGTTVIDLRKPR